MTTVSLAMTLSTIVAPPLAAGLMSIDAGGLKGWQVRGWKIATIFGGCKVHADMSATYLNIRLFRFVFVVEQGTPLSDFYATGWVWRGLASPARMALHQPLQI
jgi:hypothetical protein